ncbi:multicopper oxidase domain-containing protein [Mucilaginibacter sp.]|uniref:multicopper oxidase domain-containing protein n=1 Tax=Mucilaginibacter sp. TaxID=1882438 RepID=UPI00261B355D|nr:multicopper oxidase domain-containing protein [Mucilaginibacter sp.]
MKILFFLMFSLLFPLVSLCQQESMSMDMGDSPKGDRLPFYQKIGGRAIYHLYIGDTSVNYSAKNRPALAINGTIPAPTLYFTEGDTAEIYVHNTMMMETSIHWHGLILPNRYDGVSYLTTTPIKMGETHYYTFPIVQNGTYWYHSHSMMQQQSGLYGAIIIHKRNEPPVKEYTLLLSDWTDENPDQVDRSLHNATDWYGIRKGSTQSYAEAIRAGHFKTKLTNEWKRMTAMDVSDVYYDRFLSNGKPENEAPQFKAGDKVKLRIINGSSSTYFWLKYAGSKLTVIANDGKDVEPVDVDRMIVGVSETYDVVVTIPDNKSYEFLATAEDRTKSTSLWLGTGKKVKSEPMPRLKYFEGMKMMNDMMKMDGSMNDMGMKMSLQQMDMNTVMYPEITGDVKPVKDTIIQTPKEIITLNYAMLRSPVKTTLPNIPAKVLHFNLSGNMNRYVWTIDNKTVSETDKILIKKGENVRIILYNGTMMRHPMHLHGHFFRLLNGQGDYSPLKSVVDIMPMETDTLEFAATESGDWFFHCHILYHMMSGMGRIFSYENSPANPEVPDPQAAMKKIYADDRKIHMAAKVGLESNGSDGEVMFANTRYQLQTEWRIGLNNKDGYESESHLGRYVGQMQWWFPYVGWDFRYRKMDGPEKDIFGHISDKDNRKVFCIGVEYTLPLLVKADARFDSDGKLRFQLMREDVPLSKRLRFNFMVNTDREYMAGLRYVVTKYFSVSSHYDSDMGLGAGVTLTY